jgi:hypothetical protein
MRHVEEKSYDLQWNSAEALRVREKGEKGLAGIDTL